MKPYIPIGCDLDDRLEDAIVRGQVADLEILEGEVVSRLSARLLDVKTVEREEFLILEGNPEPIRLDRIVSLNGYVFDEESCAIPGSISSN